MLTKNDLQAIQQLIISEGKGVRKDVNDQLSSLKEDFNKTLDKKLKPIKKDIRKINKNSVAMLDFLNRDDMALLKRVKRIEEHLDLPQSS